MVFTLLIGFFYCSNVNAETTRVKTKGIGAYYHGFESDKTGEIEYSTELQLEREQIKRNTYNKSAKR